MGIPFKCDQCQALSIQGVLCHERGCPNIGKNWVYNEETERIEPSNLSLEEIEAIQMQNEGIKNER